VNDKELDAFLTKSVNTMLGIVPRPVIRDLSTAPDGKPAPPSKIKCKCAHPKRAHGTSKFGVFFSGECIYCNCKQYRERSRTK